MKHFVFAIGVFVLALAARLGGPRTVGPYDDAYHWKRIAWVAGARGEEARPGEGHPSRSNPGGLTALDFDLDRGIHGAFCPWPPLYDVTMGAVARVAGMQRIIWIPPIAFSLFVATLLIFWRSVPVHLTASQPRDLMARQLTGATIAAIAIAISPYLIGISRVASVDHHWAEPLLVAAMAGSVLRRSAIGLALAMAAAVFVQTAMLVACGVALLAILFVQGDPRALRSGAAAFAFAAAAVALYRLMRPPAYPAGPWFLGWTHAALLAAAAVACTIPALRHASAGGSKKQTPLPWRVAGLTAGALLLAPLARSIMAGTRFFSGDSWLRSIIEFQPMFSDATRIGTDIANLGGGVLALAVAAAAGMWRRHSRLCLPSQPEEHRPEPPCHAGQSVAVAAMFATIYLFLAISSRRFLVPGIVLFAIAGGIAAMSRRRWVSVAAVVLTIAPPLGYDLYAIAHREAVALDPVTIVASEIAALPAGRVLAPWHAGHAIDVLGRHGVVIDNFGSMPDPPLFVEANAALIESDAGVLRGWCRSHGVSYLALLDPDLHLPAAAACRGIPPSLYARTSLARRTVWSRLWRGARIEGFSRMTPHVWQVR